MLKPNFVSSMKVQLELKELIKDKFPGIYDEALIDEIVLRSDLMDFNEGDILIDFGDPISHIPLVIEGSVKVSREGETGKEIFLYYLISGDTCAASFSCCMIQKRSEIIAIAEEDSKVIMIPMELANEWIGKYKSWREFVFTMYDQRMFSMIDTIDRLAFSNLDQQVLEYLEQKSFATGKETIDTTHQQIAVDLNVSREAISRLLKKLENSGKVKLGRNKIQLNEN